MTKTITIPENVRNDIQALQYEVESRKNLLTFMMQNGTDIDSDNFVKYHTKYQEFFNKYEHAKQAMQDTYLQPQVEGKLINWNLDFATCEVTCEYDRVQA